MSLIFLHVKVSWFLARSAWLAVTTRPLTWSSTFPENKVSCTDALGAVSTGVPEGLGLEGSGSSKLEPFLSRKWVFLFDFLEFLFVFSSSHPFFVINNNLLF
jgi:hypothetical protein